MNDRRVCDPRPAGTRRHQPAVTAAFLVWLVLSAPAPGDDWKASRLWVVGGDDSIWVVGKSEATDNSLPIVHMWHAGKSMGHDARPKTSWSLPPVSGDPLFVGADAEALHILYSDLTVYDYFSDHSTPGARWKDQCQTKPLAWGGDRSRPVLWALARTASLVAPTTRESDETSSLLEAGEVATDKTRSTGEDRQPSGQLTLLRLDRGKWARHAVLDAASQGDRFWLAGRDGNLHLFWSTPGRGILAATLSDGTWSEPDVVTTAGDVACGWAGAWSAGAVFIAGQGEQDGLVRLQVYLRRDGTWSSPETVREGTEYLQVDPNTCGVGVVRGRLGVARLTQDGKVSFGLGELGVSPSIQFSVLPVRTETPAVHSTWEEAIVLALVLGLMTAVVWTRREQMTRPVPLPQGLVLAAVHRRVFATILDGMPAVVLATLVAWPWLSEVMGEVPPTFDLSVLQQQENDPEVQAVLIPVHYASIVLYGFWCLIWEWWIGTTPGKLMFKCHVISADGTKPGLRQCLVRNGIRVIFFALGMPGLMVTLMTMLLMSRNRQRIGDLLADTLVVERARPDT